MKRIKRVMLVNIIIFIVLMVFLSICVRFSNSSIQEFRGYCKYLSYRNRLEEIKAEESRCIERWPRNLYDSYKKTEKELKKDENVFVIKARNTRALGKIWIFLKWIAKVAVQIIIYFEIIEDIRLVIKNLSQCIKKIIRRRRR